MSAVFSEEPTTITCKIADPTRHVTTYVYGTDNELVKDSEKHYHANILPNLSGDYYYSFIGTGTCAVFEFSHFTVEDAPF
jgi:hypothetical protein